MKIDLVTLATALDRILAYARAMHGPEIEVHDDLYWFIQREDLTDPATPPGDITVGSLEDDWTEMERVARGDRDPMGYDLVWASAVLRCLGDRIS